ncbi:hypothetical protein R1flu_028543 [Riccia fluitans]|uniref:Ribosomal protein S2 n=1 Tax=Riccia fluitans TaxID=41844 RepID=A0ABD1XMI7_9MARC
MRKPGSRNKSWLGNLPEQIATCFRGLSNMMRMQDKAQRIVNKKLIARREENVTRQSKIAQRRQQNILEATAKWTLP